jgi:NADH-quinone oxidoreductase subunit J
MSYPLFFLIAVPLVVSALGVVVNRNPVRSALCLVSALFLLAVQFIFLGAHLVAALQVIVYAGAIMVLFLFVIMLLNLQQEPAAEDRRRWLWLSSTAGGLLALVVVRSLAGGAAGLPGPGMAAAVPDGFGTTAAVGQRLFTDYVIAFEITGVLLLVAVIGAVVIAKRRLG